MAIRKAASKSKQSKVQAKPRNLAPKNGTVVKGGLRFELENAKITSYSLSGHGGDHN